MAPADPQPFKVLVVDDDPTLLKILARILDKLGYQATTVDESLAALEAVKTTAFDVVITDEVMPSMSGRELAVAIKKQRPGLPVVLLSGLTDFMPDGDKEFDARLLKPIDFAGLKHTLDRLVQKK